METPPENEDGRAPEGPLPASARGGVLRHARLKRWSPLTPSERRETREFIDRISEFPYLTVGTVVFLVWAYVIQLVLSWPFTWIFPPHQPRDVLVTQVLGERLGWLDVTAVMGGEVWRVLSATMLHGSVLHVFGNCFVLYVLGKIVENAYGRAAYLVMFVVSGAVGSALSALAVGSNSLGASSAVLGLLGGALALGIRYKDKIPRPLLDYFRFDLWVFVVLVAALSALPIVDWAGHLGGFLAGLAIGMLWPPPLLAGPLGAGGRTVAQILAAAALGVYIGTVALVGARVATLEEYMPTEDLRALRAAAERGDDEAQKVIARRLVERYPDHGSVRTEIGMLLLELGDYARSVELLREVETDNPEYVPDSPFWDNNLAWGIFMAYPDNPEEVDEGLARVRRARESDPGDPVIRNTLAYGLYLDGDVGAAASLISEIMLAKSEDERGPDIYIHVLALAAQGEDARALKEYQKAFAMFPDEELQERTEADLRKRGILAGGEEEESPPEEEPSLEDESPSEEESPSEDEQTPADAPADPVVD